MTYEPLHHKYRPQTFAQLVGQDAIATTLTSALRQQRIAPAYLFTGARGTGKTSSARILAKSLNCIQGSTPTDQPCGVCEVCQSITRGNALDVIEIDAASNTGVDNIRELIERAQFAPVQCRYKVYVVDECHMLSTAAFNALLKTLEEPPDRVVFVLATTDPQKVLPTIISRCQRFDFRRIELKAMVDHLIFIAAKEAIDITPDALQLVSQISQGGLRDAQSLLAQLSLVDGCIGVDQVWDLVGAVPEKDLLQLVRAIAQDDGITVLEQTRHLMDRGREPLIVLQNLASFYRDLLIAKTSPHRNDLVAITPPTWAELCTFVQPLDLPTILQGQQLLRASEVQVKNSTQPRLWLEITLMGLLPSAIAPPAIAPTSPRPLSHPPAQPPVQSPVQSSVQSPIQPPVQPPVPPPVQPSTQNRVQTPSPQPPVSPSPHPPTSPPPAPEVPPESIPEPEATSPPVPPPEPIPHPVSQNGTSQPGDGDAIAEPAEPDLMKIWVDVLALVQPYSTQVMMNQQCQLLAFNGQEARVGARSTQLFKMAQSRLPNIETAFQKYCDRRIQVSLEVITVPTTPPPPASPPPPPAAPTPPPTPPSPPPLPPTASPPPRPQARESSPPFPAPSPPLPTPHSPLPTPHSPLPTPPEESLFPPDHEGSSQPPQPIWQSEDAVRRSTKSFAQFFNGQIVDWEDEITISKLPDDVALPDLEDADTDPDSDVPF